MRQPLPPTCTTCPTPAPADDQLRQLASQRPANQRQLAALIGAEKAELYGGALLAALVQAGPAAHASGRGASGGGGNGDGTAAGVQQQAQQQQPQQAAQQQQQQPRQAAPQQQQYPAQGKPSQAQRRPSKQARKAEVVYLDSSDEEEALAPAPARGPKRGKR